VLILDDLHLADPPSLVLLQFLARELGSARIFVVGIYSNVGLSHYQQFAQFVTESAPERHNVSLHGLTEAEAAQYIENLTGKLPPEKLLSTIRAETGGNPFFIEELVRSFVEEGKFRQPEPDRPSALFKLPEAVRQAVRQRMALLSTDAMVAVRVASIIGSQFNFGLLQCVSALPHDKLLGALAEIVGDQLLGRAPDTPGRYNFLHGLVRRTIYSDLPEPYRLRLHRRIGDVLEELYRPEAEPHLADLAYHFFESAQVGKVEKAFYYSWRAGDRAASLLELDDAVRFYQMAIESMKLRETADEDERCHLLLALGEAQLTAGHVAKAKKTLREAAETVRRLGASQRSALSRSALQCQEPEPSAQENIFRKEGDYWTIVYDGKLNRLRHVRGLSLIAYLLSRPAAQIHVMDLASITGPFQNWAQHKDEPEAETGRPSPRGGDVVEIGENGGNAAAKSRVEELRKELIEARTFGDLARVSSIEEQMAFLTRRLVPSIEYGRPDINGERVQRIRVKVTKAIKSAVQKIAQNQPDLAYRLAGAIKTGTFCSYTPEPTMSVPWKLKL
jgi:hypothetical protein